MLTEVTFIRHSRSVTTLDGETLIQPAIVLAGVFMRRDRAFTPTVLTYGGLAQPQVVGEVPTGVIDGSNMTYYTANSFMGGTLAVYLNGLRMKLGLDFNSAGVNSFLFAYAPVTGDLLTVDYIKA